MGPEIFLAVAAVILTGYVAACIITAIVAVILTFLGFEVER